MKNIARLLIIGLSLGICIMNLSHAGQNEVKLIGAEEGNKNKQLSTDIVGDTVVIASHGEGRATVFVKQYNKWTKTAELRAKDHNNRDPAVPSFAYSISITAIHDLASPSHIAIGAPRDLHGGDNLEGSFGHQGFGAVYIFTPKGKNWKQHAKLLPPKPVELDRFGDAVSIYRTTVLIGSPGDDEAGKNAGSAFVFVRNGEEWIQQSKLMPKDLNGSDSFGQAVVISGNTAIVGAPNHTHGGIRYAGAAYVFVRQGEKWREQAKLTANNPGKADRFGSSLSIAGDTLIIGAPLADTNAGRDSGAAYIFQRNGNKWQQQARLIGKDVKPADRFGQGVSTTGRNAIIGAPFASDHQHVGSGAAYSFARVDGHWVEKTKVVPEDRGQRLNYGSWVSMRGDMIIVASHNAPNEGAEAGLGSAGYVYNGVDTFDTLPFASEPFGLKMTTLGQVKQTALYQNFPNPFNPETWLPYRLGSDAPVTIHIYNMQGQLTRKLDLGTQKSGDYLTRATAAHWDGRNQVGEIVSSGVFFYTLQAEDFQGTHRMLIVK